MTAAADTAPPRVGVRSDFGRLWLGAGASNLADGLLFAGLPVLALQVTDSPALVAGVAVAIQLPMALTALPAGVLADRCDRRRLLVVGNLLRVAGLLAAIVAVVLGELQLAVVYAVAAVVGAPRSWSTRRHRPPSPRWSTVTTSVGRTRAWAARRSS